jgi:gamma-glutamyltranspeptidase / glutathione hydrolase
VIGTPGGSTIITSIFQVMSNLFDFDMPLQKAVAAPRFHHQLLPKDQITMEPYAQLSAEVQQQLTKKGYNLETQDWNLGDVQAIQVKAEKVTAAADPRSRGVAKVFEY